MSYLRTLTLVLLAFALHLGCTALVNVGWPPQPLILLAVLAIWLDRSATISRTLLPAALLVDLIQPVNFPLTTGAVLIAWFVSATIQRQWLTNHSLASLFGLAVLSVTAAGTATGAFLWLAASTGLSATPVRDAWSLVGLMQRLGLEVVATLAIGYVLRSSVRFLRMRFLYAPR